MSKTKIAILVGVTSFISLLGVLAAVAFLSFYSFTHGGASIGVGATYVDGSSRLVKELSVDAETTFKESLEEPIELLSHNKLVIDDFLSGGKLRVKITDSTGKNVLEEEIQANQSFEFQATSGEGTLELTIYKGITRATIKIN